MIFLCALFEIPIKRRLDRTRTILKGLHRECELGSYTVIFAQQSHPKTSECANTSSNLDSVFALSGRRNLRWILTYIGHQPKSYNICNETFSAGRAYKVRKMDILLHTRTHHMSPDLVWKGPPDSSEAIIFTTFIAGNLILASSVLLLPLQSWPPLKKPLPSSMSLIFASSFFWQHLKISAFKKKILLRLHLDSNVRLFSEALSAKGKTAKYNEIK